MNSFLSLLIVLAGLNATGAYAEETTSAETDHDAYVQLRAQEKAVVDDLKQNAWDKALLEKQKQKTQALLDHAESLEHRRILAMDEAARRKLPPKSRKVAQADDSDKCDSPCRPVFRTKKDATPPACKTSDFAAVGALHEKDMAVVENEKSTPTAKENLFKQITQGEPHACLYLYHHSQRKLSGLSDECLAAVTACPPVKRDQEQLAALQQQVQQAGEQLKTLAQRNDDDLKEILYVRAELRKHAAQNPAKYAMPENGTPEFHVTADDLNRNIPPWENAADDLPPPTAELPTTAEVPTSLGTADRSPASANLPVSVPAIEATKPQ